MCQRKHLCPALSCDQCIVKLRTGRDTSFFLHDVPRRLCLIKSRVDGSFQLFRWCRDVVSWLMLTTSRHHFMQTNYVFPRKTEIRISSSRMIVKTTTSRHSGPRLADLVKSLCSIPTVHEIFLPLTFPSKTQETERATSTTTYKKSFLRALPIQSQRHPKPNKILLTTTCRAPEEIITDILAAGVGH